MHAGLRTTRSTATRFQFVTKRFFDWEPGLTTKNGKPAYTGARHCFVRRDVPVVLLKDLPNLGAAGEIVTVPRGYARAELVPKGFAVWGANWENIDRYANKALVKKSKTTSKVSEDSRSSNSVTGQEPFDVLTGAHIKLIRRTKGGSNLLECPIETDEILELISSNLGIDLAYDEVTKCSFDKVGDHDVQYSILIGRGEDPRRGSIRLEIVSEAAEQSRVQQADALIESKKKASYSLAWKGVTSKES